MLVIIDRLIRLTQEQPIRSTLKWTASTPDDDLASSPVSMLEIQERSVPDFVVPSFFLHSISV